MSAAMAAALFFCAARIQSGSSGRAAREVHIPAETDDRADLVFRCSRHPADRASRASAERDRGRARARRSFAVVAAVFGRAKRRRGRRVASLGPRARPAAPGRRKRRQPARAVRAARRGAHQRANRTAAAPRHAGTASAIATVAAQGHAIARDAGCASRRRKRSSHVRSR